MKVVRANEDVLRDLIGRYHPVNLRPHLGTDAMSPDITAPQAERACEIVRKAIAKESFICPDVQFNVALQNDDAATIASLLQSAWFGVPESTGCWSIPGFSIAVDLLDDPIEEEFSETP